MKTQFNVTTHGTISVPHSTNYSIVANNEKEAQSIAKNSFEAAFPVVNPDTITFHFSKRKKSLFWVGLIMLVIALGISFIPWMNGREIFSIRPSLISSIYAIILHAVFVVRIKGISRAFESWQDIVGSILCIAVISSLFSTISSISILGVNSNIIIVVAILLSFFGIKIISLIAYIIALLLALFSLTTINSLMEIYGAVYIIFSYLGILLVLSSDPFAEDIVQNLIESTSHRLNLLSNDVRYATTQLQSMPTTKKLNYIKNEVDNDED